jgi:copper chaperone CopZ
MSEEQKQSLEARMVARFEVKDLGSPVVQKQISDALSAIQGVCDTSIEQDAIQITYDPLQTTEIHLRQAIESTGHRISAAQAAPETPHADLPRNENR